MDEPHGERELAEVIAVQLDFFEAFTQAAYQRLFGIVHQQLAGVRRAVRLELTEKRSLPMPAGSFVTHFAKGVHYDGSKDGEAIIEIVGEGPATATPAETK